MNAASVLSVTYIMSNAVVPKREIAGSDVPLP